MALKTFTAAALMGATVCLVTGAIAPSPTRAETITIDDALLERCEAEGLTGAQCACWFSAIFEAEGVTELTEADIDELAPDYQDELAGCIEANPDEYDEGEM